MMSGIVKFIYISFMIWNISGCAKANECNQSILNAYWEINKYESENEIVGSIPQNLKDKLSRALVECRLDKDKFILQKVSFFDDELMLVSYVDLSIISGNYALFQSFLESEDQGSWPKSVSHFASNPSSLHIAASYGDKRVISDILARGMSIDVEDDYSSTPLMSSLNNYDNFKYLVENGADPYKTNKSGYSVVCFVELKGMKEVSSYLKTKGYKCKKEESKR